MRRIKEVLKLYFEAGLGKRQIAKICELGMGTVRRFLNGRKGPDCVGRCRRLWRMLRWKSNPVTAPGGPAAAAGLHHHPCNGCGRSRNRRSQ
jgi:hypothetical protein